MMILKIETLIQYSNNLCEKCILARNFLKPQSTIMERIIKTDLDIKNAINNTSGNGIKNNIKYEIKISIFAKKSKFNFVQIRPDHDIDFYILICYDLYKNKLGQAYILKIPEKVIFNFIVQYGSYAHGTYKKLGKITMNNLKGRNCEYALRTYSNSNKNTKNYIFWSELLKYEVSYDKNNF